MRALSSRRSCVLGRSARRDTARRALGTITSTVFTPGIRTTRRPGWVRCRLRRTLRALLVDQVRFGEQGAHDPGELRGMRTVDEAVVRSCRDDELRAHPPPPP